MQNLTFLLLSKLNHTPFIKEILNGLFHANWVKILEISQGHPSEFHHLFVSMIYEKPENFDFIFPRVFEL